MCSVYFVLLHGSIARSQFHTEGALGFPPEKILYEALLDGSIDGLSSSKVV